MVDNKVYFAFTKNQSKYDSLETKDANTLYFIQDSQRVYKGGIDITQSIKIVNSYDATPGSGIFENKIYVNPNTLEARVAHNGVWYNIIPKRVTTSEEIESTENKDAFTTSSAVKEFVSDKFDQYKISKDHIQDIAFDSISGNVIVTFGDESTKNVTLSNVVHHATFNENTCIFKISQYGKPDMELDFSTFDGLIDARYESDHVFSDGRIGPAIVLVVQHYGGLDSEVVLDASPFIWVYQGGQTENIQIDISDDLQVTGNVIISDKPGNALESTRRGLYVDISNKADLLRGAVNNHILIADSHGNLADSGMTISSTTKLEDSATTVPTSTQVYQAIEDVKHGDVLDEGNPDEVIISTETGIIRSGKTIGGPTLSDIARGDVLATEAAVKDAISWKSIKQM